MVVKDPSKKNMQIINKKIANIVRLCPLYDQFIDPSILKLMDKSWSTINQTQDNEINKFQLVH